MPVTRLLKLNEQNLALQKSLQQSANPHAGHSGSVSASAKAHHGGATKGGGTRTGARKDGGRGTKRAREEVRITSLHLWIVGCLKVPGRRKQETRDEIEHSGYLESCARG